LIWGFKGGGKGTFSLSGTVSEVAVDSTKKEGNEQLSGRGLAKQNAVINTLLNVRNLKAKDTSSPYKSRAG